MVDIAKLRDYCLNPWHEDGKHKARVFASTLRLRQEDAPWLHQRILDAVASEEAALAGENRFGSLYVLEFRVTTPFASAEP